MSVDEGARFRLFESAQRQLGHDEAVTLMEMLPPLPWSDVATKEDLSSLGAAMKSDLAVLGSELRAEMSQLKGELRSDMSDLKGELRSDMSDLKGELRSEMSDLKGELRSEMSQLKGELKAEIADRTSSVVRTMVLAMIANNAAVFGLSFAAARLAG